MSGPFGSSAFSYNGLGDRLTQNGVNYTLDLNAGFTQVLSDGTNTYLYGLGRIAEYQGSVSEYYLGDALGSVRQLVNDENEITLARVYEPYGNLAQANGTAQTNYGFTGEFTDASGLVYLRARYYAPEQGRFTTRDTWEGNVNTPASLNRFNYAHSNPVMNTDPSGHCIFAGIDTVLCAAIGGGIAGGIIGGAYAKWMYHLAFTGKCGCEGAQLISQYTEAQFVWKGIGMGAVFGAAFSALTVASAGGAVVAALAGVGLSGYGIANSVQRIQADPNNECAWWDLGLSIFGLVGSGYALGNAVNRIGLPGGGPAPVGPLTRSSVISKLNEVVNKELGKLISISGDDLAIGFRGSLARGTVGNPKKPTYGQPVDLNNFDVDAFIISDKLANRFSGSGFRHGGDIPEINAIQNRIETTLRRLPEFSGLRPYESFEFRIWRWSEVSSPKFNPDGTEMFWYGGFK